MRCLPPKYSSIVAHEEKIKLVKTKHPALIIGFLGAGLVGNIVASEFVEQLKMEQIGYVITEDLPPIAIFYDGVLKHPFQLYYAEKENIIVAQCEVPFNKSETYTDLARLIMNWAMKIGIDEVVCIQGIESFGLPSEFPVYVAAEKEIIDRIVNKGGVSVLPRGLILGPEAALLNEGLNNELNCYALLVPVNKALPSPDGAAAIIEALNKIYDLNLTTQKLLEDAQKIREKLMELNEKAQQEHAKINMGTRPEVPRNLYL